MVTAVGCGGADLVLPSDSGPVQVMVMQGDRQAGVAGAELPDAAEEGPVEECRMEVQVLVDRVGVRLPGDSRVAQ